jgi:multidrug efflux pump
VPGARLYLQSVQDIRMGGRASNAQYQYTLQGESTSELYAFVPRLVEALENSSVLTSPARTYRRLCRLCARSDQVVS